MLVATLVIATGSGGRAAVDRREEPPPRSALPQNGQGCNMKGWAKRPVARVTCELIRRACAPRSISRKSEKRAACSAPPMIGLLASRPERAHSGAWCPKRDRTFGRGADSDQFRRGMLIAVASRMRDRIPAVALCALVLCGCALIARVDPFAWKTTVPPGTHRLGEVMAIALRAHIVESPDVYQRLLAAGISDDEIRDGGAGLCRTNCCGGPNEQANSMMFFVPVGLEVRVGDIVEVSNGGPAPAPVNTLIRVRQSVGATTPSCRWAPEQEGLWRRVLVVT